MRIRAWVLALTMAAGTAQAREVLKANDAIFDLTVAPCFQDGFGQRLHLNLAVAFSVFRPSPRTRVLVGLQSIAVSYLLGGGSGLFYPVLGTLAAKHSDASVPLEYKFGIAAGVAIPTQGGAMPFHGLLEPGLGYRMAQKTVLSVEPRVGILAGAFTFAPQLAFTFGF